MTGTEILVDSSVWLDYFLNASDKSKEYINSLGFVLYSSVLSLHEVRKKLLKDKYDAEKIDLSLGFMKRKAIMVEVDENISEKAALDSVSFSLAIADSIIYRTAVENNAKFVTMDSDFKGLEGVVLI